MKNLLLTFVFLTTCFASAQIVNIPDANFKARLIIEGVDTNNDGEIQVSEAQAVTSLNLIGGNISNAEGIQAFVNLVDLLIVNNQLSTLDVSAIATLQTLNCSDNNLVSLDVSANVNLTSLIANRNNLASINVSNNPNLETLRTINNPNLGSIDLSSCTALKNLIVRGNSLSSLNLESNPLLDSLNIGSNQLVNLDLSNNPNLKFLACGYNPLTALDVTINTFLEYLEFFDTQITTLDCNFNTNLTALYIAGNPLLETVYIKNGSDESLNMDEGSWMENWAWGNNPNLQYVCADEFQTVEIQQYAGTDYPITSFCTVPPGGDINTITGVTQFDNEGDGCDAGDSSMAFMSFNIEFDGVSTNSIAYSNNQGIYNVYAGQAGTYTLLPNLENPIYFSVSPSPADVVVPVIDGSTTVQNFCVEPVGVRPDLEVIIAPIRSAAPGFEATYRLVYKNKGNQTLSGDVQFNYDESVLDFVSSTINPDIQNAGSLTYNFTDLEPYQTQAIYIVLAVNSPTDTPPVNIDDVLTFSADINPIAGDETPLDNSFTLDQIVVGSMDPNNIICIQGEEVPTTYIGEYLHYVINFENTGTAPAETVVVTMEINPEDFDRNTLQILSASHDMQTVINGNIAEFYFQNIDLDTGGHGNILFKIKSDGDLILTDEIGIEANIYFDYNFPVETEEAITSFIILGVDEFDLSQLTVYPNPANDIVKIQSSSAIKSITVYDVQGRRIQTTEVNQQSIEVNMSALKTGIYFFTIKTENGSSMKKILKR